MTNNINDIDVSEWELKGVLIPIMECKYFEGIDDCKESKGLCVANDNCYFKQLKRLQEENEELRQVRKNYPDIQEPYVYLYRQIKKQCHELEEENNKLKSLNNLNVQKIEVLQGKIEELKTGLFESEEE